MSKQNGFTLVELMIAMLVGLILLTATGAFYLVNLRASMDSVKVQQFDKTVQVFIDNAVSEIRRACYVRGGESLPPPTDKIIGGSCIVFSHSVEDVDEPQSYGFKFEDHNIYIYVNQTAISCDGDEGAGWEQLPGITAKNASIGRGNDCETPGGPDFGDDTVCVEFDAEGSIALSDGQKPTRRVEFVSIIRNFNSCDGI